MWIEEDYCSPPLAMEREAVSVRFFDNIKVEVVSSEEDGWSIIKLTSQRNAEIQSSKAYICVMLWGNTKDSVSVRYYCLIMTP